MPTLSPELDGHVGAATSDWNTLLTADGGKSFDSTTDIASGTAGASSVNTSEFGARKSNSGVERWQRRRSACERPCQCPCGPRGTFGA